MNNEFSRGFDSSNDMWAQLQGGVEGTLGELRGYMRPFLESSGHGNFRSTPGFWI